MSNNTLICPYADNCVLYKNWSEKTGDKRVNVILKKPDNKRYECLAQIANDDPTSEGGVIFNDEIRERINDNMVEKDLGLETECSHIEILNQNASILTKLFYLNPRV